MPITAKINENYDGKRTDFDKSKLLKDITSTGSDQLTNVLETILAKRKNIFQLLNNYGAVPLIFYSEYSKDQIKQEADDNNQKSHHPLIVTSSGRYEWMGNVFKQTANLKIPTDFLPLGLNDPTAFQNKFTIPWYHPKRSNRPLYILVHRLEYFLYQEKIQLFEEEKITLIGFDFYQNSEIPTRLDPSDEAINSNLHPFLGINGIYKYAAMELMFQLNYTKAWFVDDDIIHINNFPNTLDVIENYNQLPNIIGLTFPLLPEFNQISPNKKFTVPKVTTEDRATLDISPEDFSDQPEVLQKVTLFNISELKQLKINYCPFFIFHYDLAFTNYLKKQLESTKGFKISCFTKNISGNVGTIVTALIPKPNDNNRNIVSYHQYFNNAVIEEIKDLEDEESALEISIIGDGSDDNKALQEVLNDDWFKQKNLIDFKIEKNNAIVSAREQIISYFLKQDKLSQKVNEYWKLYDSDNSDNIQFQKFGARNLSRGVYDWVFTDRENFIEELSPSYYDRSYYWAWAMKPANNNQDLPDEFFYQLKFTKHHMIPANVLREFMALLVSNQRYIEPAKPFLNQLVKSYINDYANKEIWEAKYEKLAREIARQYHTELGITDDDWESRRVGALIDAKKVDGVRISNEEALRKKAEDAAIEQEFYKKLSLLVKNISNPDPKKRIYIRELKGEKKVPTSSPTGWEEFRQAVFWMSNNYFYGPATDFRADDPSEVFEYFSENIVGRDRYLTRASLYMDILECTKNQNDDLFKKILVEIKKIVDVSKITDFDEDKWRIILQMDDKTDKVFNEKYDSVTGLKSPYKDDNKKEANALQKEGKFWKTKTRIDSNEAMKVTLLNLAAEKLSRGDISQQTKDKVENQINEMLCGPLNMGAERPKPDNRRPAKSKEIHDRFYLYFDKTYLTDIMNNDKEPTRYGASPENGIPRK